MTVKDLAQYLKLSDMMIYKLAQNGDIPAAKIGSAWRFSQEEIDSWLIKKGVGGRSLPASAGDVLEDFVSDLKEEFKENLVEAILFGSYARGDAVPGSDLDVLVVLKIISDYWEIKSKINDIAYSNTFDKDRPIVITHVLMTQEDFLTGVSPLIINIRKEGIKAA